MISMREKIAERLMRHYAEGGPWDGFMEADIVLDALSEPTEEMIAYGSEARKPGFSKWGNSRATFVAMIRAAKEGQ